MAYADGDQGFIAQSQIRCAQLYNLDSGATLRQVRLAGGELSNRKEAIEHILGRNGHHIRNIRSIAKEAGYCVLISDPDGVIVKEFSDSPDASDLSDKGLKCGTVWGEEIAGTNAIGMAILSEKTVTVAGGDHFFDSLSPFMCTAAPILGHDDKILGVIDVSGVDTENRKHLSFVRYVISQSTTKIQADMFVRHFRDSVIIRLNDGLTHHSNALLALDGNGRIEGVTRKAAGILCKQQSRQLIGMAVTDLMDTGVGDFVASVGHRKHVELANAGRCTAVSVAVPDHFNAMAGASIQARPSSRKPRRETILRLDHLAGADPVMLNNVALCRKLAKQAIPIMLQGETGAGKDAFAAALHRENGRADRPYIVVNCAAAPESLLDSELFGYAPGTFTGGLRKGKVGKFLASDGGTLMLDEIGDMPLELQGRLLRVLSEKEITPLGAVEPIAVDINVICATNKDIGELVRTEKFREDLYYRLNGATIRIPALRERADLENIIRTLASAAAGETTEIAPEAMKHLLGYPWPGNMRQLINVLRFAIACGGGGSITTADLPGDILTDIKSKRRIETAPPLRMASTRTLDESRRQIERQMLLDTLEGENWCVSKAARALGISRATINRKMALHGISRPH